MVKYLRMKACHIAVVIPKDCDAGFRSTTSLNGLQSLLISHLLGSQSPISGRWILSRYPPVRGGDGRIVTKPY